MREAHLATRQPLFRRRQTVRPTRLMGSYRWLRHRRRSRPYLVGGIRACLKTWSHGLYTGVGQPVQRAHQGGKDIEDDHAVIDRPDRPRKEGFDGEPA